MAWNEKKTKIYFEKICTYTTLKITDSIDLYYFRWPLLLLNSKLLCVEHHGIIKQVCYLASRAVIVKIRDKLKYI